MLTMEGLEGPNTQDKSERFMAWTGQHLEDSRPVFFGILGSTVDTGSCFSSRISLKFTLGRSPSAEKHMCLVLALQARQGPNTQDQTGRLKAATGHLFELTSFTWYCGESPRAKLQRVSSKDRRTPFRGQVVKQSTKMRPVLDFFATAQSLCGRSLQTVQLNGALSSCDGRRDVRIGEPGDAILRFSSRLLLGHHPAYPGMASLVAEREFRHDRRGPPFVL